MIAIGPETRAIFAYVPAFIGRAAFLTRDPKFAFSTAPFALSSAR